MTASVAATCTLSTCCRRLRPPEPLERGRLLSFVLVQAALPGLARAGAGASCPAARAARAGRATALGASASGWSPRRSPPRSGSAGSWRRTCTTTPIQNLLAARHDLDVAAKDGSRRPRVARPRGHHGDGPPSCAARSPTSTRTCSSRPGSRRRSPRTRAGRPSAPGSSSSSTSAEAEPGPNDRAVLRCTSELLANVARHARAAHVVGRAAARVGRSTACRCATTACGFDPACWPPPAVRAGHIGLVSLRERAEALGGALTLESAPGAGTVATVTIPRELLLTRVAVAGTSSSTTRRSAPTRSPSLCASACRTREAGASGRP